ncbi:MAG: hypothetical protein ACRCVJ_11065 [Clostridium sp.]|uniref:hypothetical protein n=1 Tax=Clostridium sp. TaxID=1506 RepID=UPI003F370ADC
MSRKKSFLNKGDKLVFEETVYNRTFNLYSLIAKNRFRWNNLPPELESHIIEEFLFNNGEIAFFKDESKGGFLTLPSTCNGMLNVYGEPLNFNVVGVNYSNQLSIDEMVRIKANDESIPTRRHIEHYSKWIEEIEITMKRNLKLLRQPDIVCSTKENEFSMKAMYKKIDEGEDAIFVEAQHGARGDVGISVLNRNAQNYIPELQKNKDDLIYELLTFLGINNANTSKRERMVVDEVNVNNVNILMHIDYEYKCRKDACEQINKKFGLNIDVELVIDELTTDNLDTEIGEEKE